MTDNWIMVTMMLYYESVRFFQFNVNYVEPLHLVAIFAHVAQVQVVFPLIILTVIPRPLRAVAALAASGSRTAAAGIPAQLESNQIARIAPIIAPMVSVTVTNRLICLSFLRRLEVVPLGIYPNWKGRRRANVEPRLAIPCSEYR